MVANDTQNLQFCPFDDIGWKLTLSASLTKLRFLQFWNRFLWFHTLHLNIKFQTTNIPTTIRKAGNISKIVIISIPSSVVVHTDSIDDRWIKVNVQSTLGNSLKIRLIHRRIFPFKRIISLNTTYFINPWPSDVSLSRYIRVR